MINVAAVFVAAAVAAQPLLLANPGAVQAIGPKQDDPRSCGVEAIGPKQDDPRKLAIGPKQDDPRKLAIGPKQDDPLHGGMQAGFDPETDPHANGGAEMIGPKQDDPRTGILVQNGARAIGPKQDDPRSPGQVSAYNPETDPQAAGNRCASKKKD